MSDDSEPVPKLPRGRGLKLAGPEVFRILLTAGVLVAVIVLARPCGHAVANFMGTFDVGSGKSAAMPKPDNVAPPAPAGTGAGAGAKLPSDRYVRLRPGMTDEEVKAAIEQAREKAKAAKAGSGTGTGSGMGKGSGMGTGSGMGMGSGTGSGMGMGSGTGLGMGMGSGMGMGMGAGIGSAKAN